MKVDLHNHTKHSDGVYSPQQLIERAVLNKVDIFALTDHDSVFGCDEIEQISQNYNVKVIKGLELSTSYKGESIHIVCLFKNNIVTKGMLDFSNNLVLRRKNRAIDMMNKIHDIYNLKIDLDLLFKSSEIITRANMLRNISICNNMSLNEASFYISSNSKAYIPSTKMSVKEGLDLAHENNCIAILAHPCLIKNQDYVSEILDFGFDGIEVRYPKHEHEEEHFKKLARQYNLLCSAGSDCHGDETHSDIGTCTLNEEEFLPIANKLNFKF